MLLLNGTDLKKMFAGETLFDGVSFKVYDSDKIGFIGVNGAGKSTLFKMIAEGLDYDGGTISISKETKIGYLRQYIVPDGDISIIDEVLSVFSEVREVERQLEEICTKIAECDGNLDSLIQRQADLQERFLMLDGTHYLSKVKATLTGLGFSESEFQMPLCKLSGGQKTRVALCKILLSNANLLLLDEPTNHLDIESVEWLENFLISYKGAFIVISHDRYFLDRVTEKTFDLENGHLRCYDGNYSAYMAQREIDRLTEQRNYDWAVTEIKRLEEVILDQWRWKHKKNKKTHTIDNKKKAIERIQRTMVAPEKDPKSLRFKFKASPGGGRNVLKADNISMAFDGKQLFHDVNFLIEKDEKVFLLGPNGCGKTTLIKIFMEKHQPTGGTYKIGESYKVGYYDQLKEHLHKEKQVIDEVWDDYPAMMQVDVRRALAALLFQGEDVFKSVGALSGGELARVDLTKLLLKDVNFLILDEPTNHLDIRSREALEAALAGYDGTMLMVSHDRYFINRLADRILYLTTDGITSYDGGYDEFTETREEEKAKKAEAKAAKQSEPTAYEVQKQQEAERRKLQNRLTKVERLIEEAENKIAQLKKEYDNPDLATDFTKLGEIAQQIESLQNDIDGFMEEWANLQVELETNK